MSLNIGVILGSTRPNRAGKAVADWFMDQTKQFPDINFNFIDLLELNLPFLDEPIPPLAHKYSKDHTKKWAETVENLDGFVVITSEYNHGYPGSLKNALDFLYQEWNHKPIGFVSYGNVAGGSRSVEQLRQVAVELQMASIKQQILIPVIWEAVKDGKLDPDKVKGNVKTFIEDLRWWAEVLKTGRTSNH